MRAVLAVLCLSVSSAACSATRSVYLQAGYDGAGRDAVKRIAVVGWAPAEHEGAGAVLARVAADFIKLRRDYLVQESSSLGRGWSDHCVENREGVLVVRALGVQLDGDEVELDVAAELYRCGDGALVWRAEGDEDADSDDDDLAMMVDAYRRELGAAAARFAAPAFVLLQDLLGGMPNPVLDDDDIMEKIELD